MLHTGSVWTLTWANKRSVWRGSSEQRCYALLAHKHHIEHLLSLLTLHILISRENYIMIIIVDLSPSPSSYSFIKKKKWPYHPALVWSQMSFVFSLRSPLAQGARLLVTCLVWTVQHPQLRAQSVWTQRSRRWWNSNPRPSPTSHQSPSAPCPRRPPNASPCPPKRSVLPAPSTLVSSAGGFQNSLCVCLPMFVHFIPRRRTGVKKDFLLKWNVDILLTPANNKHVVMMIIIIRLLLSAHVCFVSSQSTLLSFLRNFFYFFYFFISNNF